MSKNEAPDLVQTNPIQFFHVNFKTMVFYVQASVVASVVGDLVGAVINWGIGQGGSTEQSEIQTCP